MEVEEEKDQVSFSRSFPVCLLRTEDARGCHVNTAAPHIIRWCAGVNGLIHSTYWGL